MRRHAPPRRKKFFGAASETFSQKNINCSIDESLDRFATVARIGASITVFAADGTAQFDLVDSLLASAEVDAAPGHLAAPMPGNAIQVSVQPGDAVKRGATLMVLDAMKMEHSIAALMYGKI